VLALLSRHVHLVLSVQGDVSKARQVSIGEGRGDAISGTTATLRGTVSLSSSSDCAQTWIATGVVYRADAGNEDGEVFAYPAGGSAIAVLGSGFPLPLGTVAASGKAFGRADLMW
jgi:hypothetical protein